MMIDSLRIREKLVLIVGFLLIPIILLAWLFAEQSFKDIDFARKERDGVVYLRGVWPVLRAVELSSVEGEPPTAVLKDVPDLTALSRFDLAMETGGAAAALRESLQDIGWPSRKLARDAGTDRAIAAARTLIGAIGDGSNLALDPDIDSFYLTELLTNRLPEYIDRLGALRARSLATEAGARLGDLDRLELAVLLREVESAASAVSAAYAAAVGKHPESLLAQRLAARSAELRTANDHLAMELRRTAGSLRDNSDIARLDLPALERTIKDAAARADSFWYDSATELDRLLAERASKLTARFWSLFGIAGMVTVLATGLALHIGRGIATPLSEVRLALQALADDKLHEPMPVADRKDEIGQMLAALHLLQRALVKSKQIQARARDELKAIMDHSVDGLILIDQNGLVLSFSEPAERMFGYRAEDVVGQNIRMLLASPAASARDDSVDLDSAAEAAWIGGDGRELQGKRKDGSIFPMEWSVGNFTGGDDGRRFVATVRDITGPKAAEEQLRQSQKMDAIGQLTGGVAHDFNNLLTVIIGTIEILGDGVTDRPELAAIARLIDEAANRGATLTQQLLAFSRKQPLDPRDVDINFLITDTTKLLRPTLGEQVEIAVKLDPAAWHAMVDTSQLSTALLNLALNARDAMPGGGVLTFETGNVVLDGASVGNNPDVAPGSYVVVAVGDTGTGIPADLRARIFEPFFTTKDIGKGTGLGLSMVYGFIKQSRGHIKVDSETQRGTTIRIYLPRSDEQVASGPAEDDTATLSGNHETILVVEDDDLVRTYVLAQLQSLGYVTLAASDAAGALDLADRNTPFDLIFTDVIMPGRMNGRQLADEIRKRRPAVKVLYTSGYNENAIVHHGRLDPDVMLLAKPYRKIDLAKKVREALRTPAA
nr:PAS domain S-box protein [Bradyrhizobium diazoefficiens]